MKILLQEAFDASAPRWLKDYLSQPTGSRNSERRAGSTSEFDASTAVWTDVSEESAAQLRARLKSGTDVLFFKMPSPSWARNPRNEIISVKLNPDNKVNGLRVTGTTSEYKDMSFKKITEIAEEIYYTSITADRKNKVADRQKSRYGVVSRKGDSAQNSDWQRQFDATSKWVTDASGYTYDANRLSRKLAAMHEGDSAYYVKKAAEAFMNMASAYSEKINEMSSADTFDTGTFSRTGFSYIVREGNRVLTDAAEDMNRLKHKASLALLTMDEVKAKRDGAPFTDEEYYDWTVSIADSVKDYYLRISALLKKMKNIVNGLGESVQVGVNRTFGK